MGSYRVLAAFAVLLAAAIRLPDLGFKPLMHDESLFAYYSHYLWTVGTIDYDPVLHGPLLQQVNAIVFTVLGDSDATVRLFGALCGIGIVAAIVWLKPLPDPWANLAGGFFVAVSPSFCYYSRFCRNDVPFSLFAILWVCACAKYWRTRRSSEGLRLAVSSSNRIERAGWGAAAILFFTGMACVKEVIVFLIVAAVAYGLVLVAADLLAALPFSGARNRDRKETGRSCLCSVRTFLTVNNVVLVLLVIVYFLLRGRPAVAGASPIAIFAAIVLLAPCLSVIPAVLIDAARTGAGAESLARRIGQSLWRDRYALGTGAAAGLILFLLVYNYWQIGRFSPIGVARQLLGHLTGASHEPIQWVNEPVPGRLSGTLGAFDIIHRAVSYWWGQHAEHRLRGPFHYYVPLLAIYEWPLLAIVSIGAAAQLLSSWRRAIAAVLAAAAAVPIAWTASRALTPQRLDGWFHMQSFAHLDGALLFSALAFVLIVGELLARRRARAFLMVWFATTLMGLSYAGEKTPWLTVHIALPLSLLAGEYAVMGCRWAGRAHAARERKLPRTLAHAVSVLALLACIPAAYKWSLDTGRLLGDGSNAAERMVYNHTTTQIKALAGQILDTRDERKARGQPFLVAMAGEALWPMYWHMRGLQPGEFDVEDDLTTTTADMVVCDGEQLRRWPELERRYEIRKLPLRTAWVPPTISFGRLFMKDADETVWPARKPVDLKAEARWLWRYWRQRELFPVDKTDRTDETDKKEGGDPTVSTTIVCGRRRMRNQE